MRISRTSLVLGAALFASVGLSAGTVQAGPFGLGLWGSGSNYYSGYGGYSTYYPNYAMPYYTYSMPYSGSWYNPSYTYTYNYPTNYYPTWTSSYAYPSYYYPSYSTAYTYPSYYYPSYSYTYPSYSTYAYSYPTYYYPSTTSSSFYMPSTGYTYGMPAYDTSNGIVQTGYFTQPNITGNNINGTKNNTNNTTAANKSQTTVKIMNDSYEPATVTVAPGTTVRWVNDGKHVHTVTSTTGAWKSGDIQPGQDFTATFTQPGTFEYHCAHEPNKMKGTVIVK
jgi:plastocyanin